jgi:BirA family biotin operon repressor/biotin-[acetyl-CoA-carboxylase] ligase
MKRTPQRLPSRTFDGPPPGAPPDRDEPLTPAALQRCLHAAVFGHRVFYYPTIGSTNDRALECAADGESEGILVLAEEQTEGRGRRERSWASGAYLGIYASLVLRPALPTTRAPLFTLMAAVSVADALDEMCGLTTRIKWPNDVLVGRRKIAGVLGEIHGAEHEIRDLVIGLGINVNQTSRDFPPDLQRRATSVRIENRVRADRAPILAGVLERFERRYSRLLRDGPETLLREWESRSTMAPSQRIVVGGLTGHVTGAFHGIDEEGALVLLTDDGAQRRVPFGEILDPLEG